MGGVTADGRAKSLEFRSRFAEGESRAVVITATAQLSPTTAAVAGMKLDADADSLFY